MSRRMRYKKFDNSSDYQKGYLAGQKAAFEESELDAYFTGVGYGKKEAGDKKIGFNNVEEQRQFEKGVASKDKHFISSDIEKGHSEGFIVSVFGFFFRALTFPFRLVARIFSDKPEQKNYRTKRKSKNRRRYRATRKKR